MSYEFKEECLQAIKTTIKQLKTKFGGVCPPCIQSILTYQTLDDTQFERVVADFVQLNKVYYTNYEYDVSWIDLLETLDEEVQDIDRELDSLEQDMSTEDYGWRYESMGNLAHSLTRRRDNTIAAICQLEAMPFISMFLNTSKTIPEIIEELHTFREGFIDGISPIFIYNVHLSYVITKCMNKHKCISDILYKDLKSYLKKLKKRTLLDIKHIVGIYKHTPIGKDVFNNIILDYYL